MTYHFRNKVDLALELADSFEAELRAAAAPFSEAPSAHCVLLLLEQVLRVLWRYRFLLTAPNYLAAVDLRLEQRYGLVHHNMRQLIRRNTMALVEAGVMQAPSSAAAEIIADNLVAIWIAWLQLHGLSNQAELDSPTPAMLLDCFAHHFGLLQPYVSRKFMSDLDHVLRTLGEADANKK